LRKHKEKLNHSLLSRPREILPDPKQPQEKLAAKNARPLRRHEQKLDPGQANQGPGSATPKKRGEGPKKKLRKL